MTEILKNPKNPIIISKRLDFKAYGIDIRFEDEALAKIAEMAAKEKTGARGLVSAIEKVLIPFEKKLPSTEIDKFLVTLDVVESPEDQLELLLKNPDDSVIAERFEEARKSEFENIKKYICMRADDFRRVSALELSEERTDLLAQMYVKTVSDINAIFDEFAAMHNVVKLEETSLVARLEAHVTFDEGAVDAIIAQAIEKDQKIGSVATSLGKRLEYGLNLVKARSGIKDFIITDKAVNDLEGYIDNLIKKLPRQESMPDATDIHADE